MSGGPGRDGEAKGSIWVPGKIAGPVYLVFSYHTGQGVSRVLKVGRSVRSSLHFTDEETESQKG